MSGLNQPQVDVLCAGHFREMGLAQGIALQGKLRAARQELHNLEAFRLEQPRWMPYACFRALVNEKFREWLRRE